MELIKTKAFMASGVPSIIIVTSIFVGYIIGDISVFLSVVYLLLFTAIYYYPVYQFSKSDKNTKITYSSKLWTPGIIINNLLALYWAYSIIDVAIYSRRDPAASMGIFMIAIFWIIQFAILSNIALFMKSTKKLNK